jgi:geranylgeranyl diphosphate synthase type II
MSAPELSTARTDRGTALTRYLAECRELVLDELRTFIPADTRDSGRLYELMLEYPLRDAKGLRPALCIATCRALGGLIESVLHTAAVLELYHNAFLIHDDVEDESELRRKADTLHRRHGVPIAINVGDGMLALALSPLLDNMQLVGMGKALRVLKTIGDMARASAEGQAIELGWIRDGCWDLSDGAYLRMIYKKSAWYTFVTPVSIGSVLAGCDTAIQARLRRFAIQVGLAFQIQDDVLNLVGDANDYGKEIGGDLWEGKHTLMLLHALRSATPLARSRARTILAKRRPRLGARPPASFATELQALVISGDLTEQGRRRLSTMFSPAAAAEEEKTEDDVAFLRALIERHDSIAYARREALRRAEHARRLLEGCSRIAPSVHRDFLESLVDYVIERTS